MAPGREVDRSQAARVFFAAGRLVGFLVSAVTALGILAAVTLLPAYAAMLSARYDRDCEKCRLAGMEALAVANDRLIAAAQEGDPVLIKRLAMSQLGYRPADETIADPNGIGPVQLVTLPHIPRPAPPAGNLQRIVERLTDPNTRRGLLALAAGAMMTAMLAFSPPEKYRKTNPPAAK